MATFTFDSVSSSTQALELDTLFNIASDLETVVGKLECHAALLNDLTKDTDLILCADVSNPVHQGRGAGGVQSSARQGLRRA